MDLSETINHARTARDAPPTPSDDYGRIDDPIENQNLHLSEFLLRFLPHGRMYGPSDPEYERNERKRRVWGEVEVLKSEQNPTNLSGISSILHGGIDFWNSELFLLREEPVRSFFLAANLTE